MRVLELPRRRYSMPETVMRKYRLRQRLNSSSEGSSGSRRRRGVDRSSQTSPRESIGRTGSYPSLATPSPQAWSCPTSDYQTVSDKTISTQDSTLSIPSSNSESPCRSADVRTRRTDRTTSITGLDYAQIQTVEVGVSVETDISEDTVIEAEKYKEESTQVGEDVRSSIACQADTTEPSKVPKITLMNEGTDPRCALGCVQVKEESSQVCRRDIVIEMDPFRFNVRKIPTDIACSGGNYEDFPVEKPVVPRYSAVPRTNSMLVNASSVEYYSSDSDLSLTDSLEDPDEFRTTISYKKRHTRHDDRLVRGEVSVEQEKRRLPKSRDAYAYFLSLTGEEDAIREYSIPDWLRERLRRREEEMKKVYEDKLTRHQQCGYFRRRKKTNKRGKQRNSYTSGDVIKKNDPSATDNHLKNEKTVRFQDYATNNINNNNNNVHPSTSDKCSIRLLNGNNMGLEPKIDNVYRDKNNHNNHTIVNNCKTRSSGNNNQNHSNNGEASAYFTEGNPNQLLIHTKTENSSHSSSNLVHISEVIKIELSDNKSTIITKEKQINLAPETNLQQPCSETLKNELTNKTKSVITKGSNSQLSAELEDTNTIQSIRQVNIHSPKRDIPSTGVSLEETGSQNNEKMEEQKENDTDRSASGTSQTEAVEREKIELDRDVANILISALEENTKAHLSKTNEASLEKTEEKEETFQKYQTTAIQTDAIEDSNSIDLNKSIDQSCNTDPYLVSIYIQTSDKDKSSEDYEESENMSVDSELESQDEVSYQVDDVISSFDASVDESVKMVDKACNTVESVSISTQTNESILQSEDNLNKFKKGRTPKKKDVLFPPQVIRQIITGTGEYKTIEVPDTKGQDGGRIKTGSKKGKIHKGTNTEETESVLENNKNLINRNLDESRPVHTPFCKNVFLTKTQPKKSEVLELNVPACSCHMCTLQKISPRAESKSKIPQHRRPIDLTKEEKKSVKIGSRKSAAKFRVFEAIPEERSGYSDVLAGEREGYSKSSQEEKDSCTQSKPEERCTYSESLPGKEQRERKREEKGVLTEPHLVDQVVQVGSNISTVATNTEPELPKEKESVQHIKPITTQAGETQTDSTHAISTQTVTATQRKSNLVIGRFRSESQESPMLYRQYKGRASLSAGQVEGQEELLTLSKGWINFYLLKDNFDLSDSNTEEPPSGRRRVKIEEDKVEEYTLEIHATPEPSRLLLPNLKRNGAEASSRGALPEIQTSSSSSTPEKVEKKAAVETLPGFRRTKKTRRINLRKEAIKKMERPARKDRASAPPTTTNERKEKLWNFRNAFVDSGRKEKAYNLSQAMKFTPPFVKVVSATSGNLPEVPVPGRNDLRIVLNDYSMVDGKTESLDQAELPSSQAMLPPSHASPSTATHTSAALPRPSDVGRNPTTIGSERKADGNEDTDRRVAEYFSAETKYDGTKHQADRLPKRSEALKMFLLSLLPDLEELPPTLIRTFKRKSLSLIEDLIELASTSSSSIPSTTTPLFSPASSSTHSPLASDTNRARDL